MTTQKQKIAARRNIRKAQQKWRSMTKREHSLAQPEGRRRKLPGTTGAGKFYRIEVRPKGEFVIFRNQDVGKKGGLERLAGRRGSGSWDTISWLVSKNGAHVDQHGHLKIDDPKMRTALKQVRGRIVHVKGDVFRAHPRKNVPESEKPTRAERSAQRKNLKKAQLAHRKKA